MTDAVRDLTETSASLAHDPAPVETLTKMLLAIGARLAGVELPAEQVSYLYETGAFIVLEDHKPSPHRGRVKVQLVITEDDYLYFFCNQSLNDTAGYVGWKEGDVLTAVHEARLCAIEELSLTRFRSW